MKFVGTYIDETMKWLSIKVYAAVTRFGSAVAGLTVALLVLVTVFWLALSLHLAFVHAFLPVQSHEWPLHLDFSTCPHRPGLCSEPSATIPIHNGVASEVPSPYPRQLPVRNVNWADGNSQACTKQRGDGSGCHRDKAKGAWRKDGKSRRERRNHLHLDENKDEELLQRWQEILDLEDVAPLPSEHDVSPEEYEAALEQRRLRRLKLFHQAKSSLEEELNEKDDLFYRSPPSCSKPGSGCSSPDSSGGSPSSSSLFARGQRYSITVHLEMPDSETNRRLGMFPVEVSLLDANQGVLTTARRPVLLPYRSSQQRFAWSMLQVPSLLLRDSYPETHELELVLFESFVDDPLQPAEFVSVSLRSRFVQVSSCRVSVVASFSGLRRLLHRHPLLSAAVGTLTNMALLLAALTVVWLRRTEKSRLHSTPALSSGQRTTSLVVNDTTTSRGRNREKIEDLLQDDQDKKDDEGGLPSSFPLAVAASQGRPGLLASLTDTGEDGRQHPLDGDALQDGNSTDSESIHEELSVVPKESLLGGGNRVAELHCHDLHAGEQQQHGAAVQAEEASSASSSPEPLSHRSSRDHTDDEFTLLPGQGDPGAGLRQRATAPPPPPTEATTL